MTMLHGLRLEPHEQGQYVELCEQVRTVMAREHGLAILLNAIVATGGEFARDDIERWVEESRNYSSDDRDTAAFCHGPELLIGMPPVPVPISSDPDHSCDFCRNPNNKNSSIGCPDDVIYGIPE